MKNALPKLVNLFALLILLTASSPSWAFSNCHQYFDSSLKSVSDVQMSDPLFYEVEQMNLKTIREAEQADLENIIFLDNPPPVEFKFNNLVYDVIGFLGRGAEGIVYIVSRNGERYLVKHFKDLSELNYNLNALNRFNIHGVTALTPIAINEHPSSVLFPYITGITVMDFLESNVSPQLQNEMRNIYLNYYRNVRLQPGCEKCRPLPQNIIIDVHTNKIIVFDPH